MSNLILCPTRGGKDSYPNQDRAVSLAKERGVGVLFLYITNVEFLDLTAAPKLIDIEHELDEMGEFMLAMAQERAEKAGVAASTLVKHGHFRQALVEVIEEFEISSVVLGSSAGETGVVTSEYIQDLADEIGSTTGVEFIVVDQGEIVSTYKPEARSE
jgi:nucleotide-binding universal stress UspA family protein